MSREQHQPTRVQSHHVVGVWVFLETHRRILGGKFGSIPAALKDDAFSMAGYCLDAHDLIPAGSTAFHRFGAGADEWIAEPTTAERCPASGA